MAPFARPPRFLQRTPPRYAQGRPFHDPDFGPANFPFTPNDTTSLVQLAGVLWIEFNPAEPADFTQYQSAWVYKGWNWAIWESALNARITARSGTPSNEIFHLSGNNVELFGEVCIDLASMFDVVVLGHWLPEVAVAAIKARSTAPNGTQVLFWGDFESIRQRRPLHSGDNQSWINLRPLALSSAQLNAYGCTCIDNYEATTPNGPTSGWVACPHSPLHSPLPSEASQANTRHRWDVDIWAATDPNPTQAEATIETGWVEEFDNEWPTTPPDGVLFDRLLNTPDLGSASVLFPQSWEQQYRTAWRFFADAWNNHGGTPTLWANGPVDVSIHDQERFPRRYFQDFFREGQTAKTIDQIRNDLHSAVRYGLTVILSVRDSVDGIDAWAKTAGGPDTHVNGTWAAVVGEIRSAGAANVYVSCWQTESPEYAGVGFGFAYWQSNFRTPT